MKSYTLPDGQVIELHEITRVHAPQYDWKKFWSSPIKNLTDKAMCHYFELDVRPGKTIRVYDDKELYRFRILMQFIVDEDMEEILA